MSLKKKSKIVGQIFGLVAFSLLFAWLSTAATGDESSYSGQDSLTLCSFNIQFLGSSKVRKNKELASILKDYDLVIIQEVIAPPRDGEYPNGEEYTKNPYVADFFNEMMKHDFKYAMSEEDTGPGKKNHKSNSATEWSVVFYKSSVGVAKDLPNRFIGKPIAAHEIYRRVPYAHSFRTRDNNLGFVIVNVHLYPDRSIPGMGSNRKEERKKELAEIAKWIDQNDDVEKDFLIVGDMNINNGSELDYDTPPGYISLNDELRKTNTAKTSKPYDHVMYRPQWTTEIDEYFDLRVIDLAKRMKPLWNGPGNYPGDPYRHNRFRKYFSDHRPIAFRMNIPDRDDDYNCKP